MALQAKYYSLHALLPQPQTHSSNCSKTIRIATCCAHHVIQAQAETMRTKKKLKPSFFQQIRHKWSSKISSPRERFPWQEQEKEQDQELEIEEEEEEVEELKTPQSFGVAETDVASSVSVPVKNVDGSLVSNAVKEVNKLDNEVKWVEEIKIDDRIEEKRIEFPSSKPKTVVGGLNGATSVNEGLKESGENCSSNRAPWRRDTDNEGDKRRRNNTELAERMIPEHELRRLRNVSLRMLERIKVKSAGITQALVDSIHEKWKVDEVVKLKFEEPHSLNMKRTHEILERRTGGLVIWRSGSSVVLFRGMAYKLPCGQSFTKQNQMLSSDNVVSNLMHNAGENNLVGSAESFIPSAKYLENLSEEELMDLTEFNYLLDELGPRFTDWPGSGPLPVDEDLLPPVVPGYIPPFRLLPYGIRQSLRDNEVTTFRRLARKMPPHFALGRNRQLQGLAQAMVKLWEKNAIAKIAIKRGVLNTSNERMAEELKKLTGGTLLSRNKDYIVFYSDMTFRL
ncbi:CRM-domain containing factor CFM3A, chloroplastic/mitochondrial-like [Pistacia vera]|uniref:CRM-domain containing factor CFM3A, chloroplastic/mitochondrial-like n=1 Tax=Pistacia vera TaxID=55513 RepID=UPI001263CDBB|nr:CRM-domain containing factor CFM3A, chloroplastic/mitochondrial-like [Pistacia vera]